MTEKWAISSGRSVDGDPYGEGFGPFRPEDMAPWFREKHGPEIDWAPTVEEAWTKWEQNLWRQVRGWEAQAERLRATIHATRALREELVKRPPS